MITRGAALEYGDAGIRINGVAPGQIATEFTEGGPSKPPSWPQRTTYSNLFP